MELCLTGGESVPNLLLDLEIDAACWEFLVQRIILRGGVQGPQPVVEIIDAQPLDEVLFEAS
jgi:hypothetical protein